MTPETKVDALRLAQMFHEAYERLAPSFGYETRKASAKPWDEVPEQNRNLMVAVCAEIAQHITLAQQAAYERAAHWAYEWGVRQQDTKYGTAGTAISKGIQALGGSASALETNKKEVMPSESTAPDRLHLSKLLGVPEVTGVAHPVEQHAAPSASALELALAQRELQEAQWWWDYFFGVPQSGKLGIERLEETRERMNALRARIAALSGAK